MGLASVHPEEIAQWLRDKIRLKQSGQPIPGHDPKVGQAFTREAQTRRLETLLQEVVQLGQSRIASEGSEGYTNESP